MAATLVVEIIDEFRKNGVKPVELPVNNHGQQDRAPPEERWQGENLLRRASSARSFRGVDARPYVTIPVAGHFECHDLYSRSFRHWLMRLHLKTSPRPVGDQ